MRMFRSLIEGTVDFLWNTKFEWMIWSGGRGLVGPLDFIATIDRF